MDIKVSESETKFCLIGKYTDFFVRYQRLPSNWSCVIKQGECSINLFVLPVSNKAQHQIITSCLFKRNFRRESQLFTLLIEEKENSKWPTFVFSFAVYLTP